MKKYVFAVALLIPALCSFSQQKTFRLATYNLKNDNPQDSRNPWTGRRIIMAKLIKKYRFDIFCTQEAKSNQVQHLITAMPEYSWTGIDKSGKGTSEYCAIFYKKDRFTLLDTGRFWLSETPEKVSKGWDAQTKRVCSWVYMSDLLTGNKFYVFDTHLDHKGELARENSIKLILEKIQHIAGNKPAVLCGDFNFDRNSPNYSLLNNSGLLRDAFELATFRYSSGGSFNRFNINSLPKGPIDHIFVTAPRFKVRQYNILMDSYGDKLPSDHYPVSIEISDVK